MAENLHDFSPGQALDFLERMIANENPLVRSNVARALARIATPETIAMLFNLYADADYGVKREALKGFKQLHQRIAVNSLKLEPETERKIKTLITEEKSRGEWII
jgi:HEAT repeat protein